MMTTTFRTWLQLLVLLSFTGTALGLFADQAGKFDWSRKLIGCPKQIILDKSISGNGGQLLVLSEENVVGSIDVNSGDIKWRHFQESQADLTSSIVTTERFVIAAVAGGKLLRAWDKTNGLMKWEVPLSATSAISILMAENNGHFFTLVGNTLFNIAAANGKTIWKLNLEKTSWLSMAVLENGSIGLVGAEADVISAVIISPSGSIESTHKYSNVSDVSSCINLNKNGFFACYGSETAYFVDASNAEAISSYPVRNVKAIAPVLQEGHYAIQEADGTSIVQVANGIVEQRNHFAGVQASAVIENNLITLTTEAVFVYDIKSGSQVFGGPVKRLGSSLISRVLPLSSTSGALSVLLVGEDCQMGAVNIKLASKKPTEIIPEWTRHEALAYISSVEMVDLPLSKAEVDIEAEFSMSNGNAWHAFTQRLKSQLDQVCRTVIEFFNELITIVSFNNINSFSDVLAILKGKNAVHSSQPFERDYFNMKKLIVATTLKGAAYGIDSTDGSVRWVLTVGNDFEPLASSVTGEERVPLLIQRGTSHYKFPSQAVVATNSAVTKRGCLTVFNPMTGVITTRIYLQNPLRRVELLPYHTEEMLQPLAAIETNMNVTVFPFVSSVPDSANHIHMMWVENDGRIYGTHLDVLSRKLTPTWQSDLSLSEGQKIIAIAGKPPHQKVHSQGRVLGDRSVLYKYVNPNLVAVAVLDSTHSILSISLIDAVTGQLIYISRHAKASGLFNMVHCENWLTYTFWNERARRMDLGVMELFDGPKQCDSERFNSLTPRKDLPIVTEKAYVFPLGVSAMAVTDTEKGLTTRNLLIAIPFGGLFEVSRRIVDARRPVEMTPEMREEMLIPYMPEIPIATEDMINYNQSVHNVRGIKTVASGLESTSLVFVYGSDLFYTKTTPSGTFDILKDDFDHFFIGGVLAVSVVGGIVLRWLARFLRRA
ncbi:hypothetical protein QR680_018744 [Steinernema hermaphroditum]|uniref:ER membrane protein complex subunit 1 n=1 Tax=Steinernema hermaphroditum TaxID=289476 RepID=A0AA39HL60_9BILA|nr:hypothetical protein QR680_018744 [Steinernema hermaphroditum]